jgi:hypothetical protein
LIVSYNCNHCSRVVFLYFTIINSIYNWFNSFSLAWSIFLI